MLQSTCYDNDIIIEYLENNLQFFDVVTMEKHFYSCTECTNKARLYSEALYILKSLKPDYRDIKNFKEANIDLVILPAAKSLKNSTMSDTKSLYGKYLLKLIPIIGENKILLEVQTLDTQAEGTLIIQNDKNIFFSAPIINGFAREELDTPVDLRHVIIYITT